MSSGRSRVEEALLVVQVGAGRIAETVTLAAILRREAVVHGERRRVGEAPILANPPVQPLRRAFGRFDGQRLNGVRFEELARLLPLLGPLADARAGRDHEQRQVVAAAIFGVQNVIAQAQSVFARLPSEAEGVEGRAAARREQAGWRCRRARLRRTATPLSPS